MNRDVYIILTVNSWIVFNLTGGWLSHSLSLDKVHSRRNPVHFREEEEDVQVLAFQKSWRSFSHIIYIYIHDISDGFEFRPDRTLDYGVSCPWASGKSPYTFNRRNLVTTLVPSILNGSSSFLQLRRTTIKAWMSLNFVKIPSPIIKLAPLEHLKNLWIMLWPL